MSTPSQTNLCLQWNTELVRQPDGSWVVRPLDPVRQVQPLAEVETREISVAETAERLRISVRAVRRLCEAGDLVAYKPNGRDWQILAAAVKLWRARQKGAISPMDCEREMADLAERWRG